MFLQYVQIFVGTCRSNYTQEVPGLERLGLFVPVHAESIVVPELSFYIVLQNHSWLAVFNTCVLPLLLLASELQTGFIIYINSGQLFKVIALVNLVG